MGTPGWINHARTDTASGTNTDTGTKNYSSRTKAQSAWDEIRAREIQRRKDRERKIEIKRLEKSVFHPELAASNKISLNIGDTHIGGSDITAKNSIYVTSSGGSDYGNPQDGIYLADGSGLWNPMPSIPLFDPSDYIRYIGKLKIQKSVNTADLQEPIIRKSKNNKNKFKL